MKSAIVTGGSGKAGKATIRELLAHGYQVMNVDTVAPGEQLCHFMKTDLNDLGQTVDALRLMAGTIDRRRMAIGDPPAVIHLAGIPAPGLAPDATVFQNNMMTTYNVFSAAVRVGLKRVVWASSETTYGIPFTRSPPQHAPIMEEHPLAPESGRCAGEGVVRARGDRDESVESCDQLRRPAHLQHLRGKGLRRHPLLLGRSGVAPLESLELGRRP